MESSSDWRSLITHSAELRVRSAQAREASAQLIAASKQLAIWRAQRLEEIISIRVNCRAGPRDGMRHGRGLRNAGFPGSKRLPAGARVSVTVLCPQGRGYQAR